jgi:TRAP-type C4-dicarboxylate transport system substrate-binding protein
MTHYDLWRRIFVPGVLLALLAGLSTTGHAQTASEYDQVRLRYAGYLPASHVREIFTQKWMDETTKRSGGRVQFDAFRDQALVRTTDLLDGASRGISDISYLATGYFPTELPLTTLLEMPFLANNSEAQMATALQMYQEFDQMRAEYEKNNLVLIGNLAVDPTIMASRAPWNSIADIKGKRIRAFGLINQVLAALGATPVALPAPDIYASMERRVIEGFSGFPANLIPSMSLFEVSEYIIDYGAGTYAMVAIAMNKTRFDGLNPKTQSLLVDTFSELVRDIYIADLTQLNRDRTKVLEEKGMKFIRWSKEEREKAREIVAGKVWDEAIRTREARGVPARAFFTRFQELMAKNEPAATNYIDPVSVKLGRPN